MKRISYILAALLPLLTLISCDKDNEPLNLQDADIYGQWVITNVSHDGKTSEYPIGDIMMKIEKYRSIYAAYYLELNYSHGAYTILNDTIYLKEELINVSKDEWPIVGSMVVTSMRRNIATFDCRNKEGDRYILAASKMDSIPITQEQLDRHIAYDIWDYYTTYGLRFKDGRIIFDRRNYKEPYYRHEASYILDGFNLYIFNGQDTLRGTIHQELDATSFNSGVFTISIKMNESSRYDGKWRAIQ